MMTQENLRKDIRKMIAKIYRYECQVSYGWFVTSANLPENLEKELLELVKQLLPMTEDEIQKEIESLEIQLLESETRISNGQSVDTDNHPIVKRKEVEIFKAIKTKSKLL